MNSIPLTIIESPYAGDVSTHILYARRAMRHSLLCGEAPFASHLLYTQEHILDDLIPAEREMGMRAGWAWMERAHRVAVYIDYGVSPGMEQGIKRAKALDLSIYYREIGRNP